MKLRIYFKDGSIEDYNDVDIFAVSDYTIEIKNYNGYSKVFAKPFTKTLSVIQEEE